MIYFLGDRNGHLKIGFSDRPIEHRIAELQTGSTAELELIATIPAGTRTTEQQCHRNWEADRVRGEWFLDSPVMRERIQRLAGSMIAEVF